MLLASGALALLVAASFVVLIVAIVEQRDSARLARQSQQAIASGSQLEKLAIDLETGLRGFVSSGREDFLAPYRRARRAYPRESQQLERLVSSDGQRARVRGVRLAMDDYVELWAQPLISLQREDPRVARNVANNVTGRERIESIRGQFGQLIATERELADDRESRAASRSRLAIGMGIGAVSLMLAGIVALALYMSRAVLAPVRRVAAGAERVAGGDLAARVPDERDDEVGDLARAFNSMASSLETGRAQLLSRTEDLERSNRELDQFASVTSHDLKEPLNTVSMYAELLARRYQGQLDAEGQHFIECIVNQTERMRGLIHDLLEYSRLGQGELRRRPVSCDELVERTRETLASALAEKDGVVEAEDLPTVEGDPHLLEQLFQNLVTNALKFTDGRPPRVQVTAARDGAHWRLSVRDNGIGIPAAHAERIFEPFQRLHAGDRFEGTGIGLAICQKIVEHHGGRIWVESEVGVGSTFSFTLPAAPGPVEDAEPRVPAGTAA